jgi:phosphatidylethanolamine/phosphatidyl-N-methylethanolamine N-methyltransferase
MDVFRFFWSFLRHPKDVSSIIPTSRWSARRLATRIPTDRRVCVVEYGPGTGVVSWEVLRRMTPDSKLLLIEKTPMLAQRLKADFATDARAVVVEGDALEVEQILRSAGESSADVVLTSIPFSLMTPEVRRGILEATKRALRVGGILVVFLFRPVVGTYVAEVFPTVKRSLLWWNIPPLMTFEAEKSA